MTRYAVGDLQGCLQPLQCLLEEVSFNPDRDQLWLVGDLINRGPASLQTLRFIRQLGDCTRIVLGNHDLHFLAVAVSGKSPGKSDTFDEILAAKDRDQLVCWLLQQPLLYSDPSGDFHMVHAGIPPIWSLQQAQQYAREVETVLSAEHTPDSIGPDSPAYNFFRHMYGNQPSCWSEQLQGWDRLRIITNYLTRMRFCRADGELEFRNKLTAIDAPGFAPWFSYPWRLSGNEQILFGHWAALKGKVTVDNVFALDTGCVWGRSLSMMNLETRQIHQCLCPPR